MTQVEAHKPMDFCKILKQHSPCRSPHRKDLSGLGTMGLFRHCLIPLILSSPASWTTDLWYHKSQRYWTSFLLSVGPFSELSLITPNTPWAYTHIMIQKEKTQWRPRAPPGLQIIGLLTIYPQMSIIVYELTHHIFKYLFKVLWNCISIFLDVSAVPWFVRIPSCNTNLNSPTQCK